MSADLQNPIFQDETKAKEALEAVRWPDGPYCPHCGATERQARVEGIKKSHRPGLCYCNQCKATYTVTVGTVFERSKVPLSKWWLASHLMGASKKGVSAHQLHRMLGVTYKTAWFMAHRLREAMNALNPSPLGGKDKVVEADETFIGQPKSVFHNDRGWVYETGMGSKSKVLTMVERRGPARSIKIDTLSAEEIGNLLVSNIDSDSRLHTDQAPHYKRIGKDSQLTTAFVQPFELEK